MDSEREGDRDLQEYTIIKCLRGFLWPKKKDIVMKGRKWSISQNSNSPKLIFCEIYLNSC